MQARRGRAAAAVGGLLLVLGMPAATAQEGARVAATTALAPGLAHEVWQLPGSAAPVHVARRDAGSGVRLQVVQAADAAAGGLETTTSMCRRTPGCQVAVNGDFFTPDGAALGAVVVDGRMLRSPRPDHEQLSLEPLRATSSGLGDGGWSGAVRGPDEAEPLRIDGVNVPLAAGQLVLYTSQHGAATPSCTCVELRLAEQDGPLAVLGRPGQVAVTGRAAGGSPLPPGGAVLAGDGTAAAALTALADTADRAGAAYRATVEVSVAQPTVHNLGAHPIVLREGAPHPYDRADPMLARPHPRTVVAWDARGTVWLIAADGRRASGPGMTARQVLDLVRRLGATDAAMLDGGGSTTFAVRGNVANAPSDGRERPVANAVVLTWQPPAGVHAAPPPPPVVAEAGAPAAPVPAPVPPPPAPVAAPPAAPPSAAPPPPVPPPAPAPPRPVAAARPAVPWAVAAAAGRPRVDHPERAVPAAAPLLLPAPAPPPPAIALLALALCGGAGAGWLRVVARWPTEATGRRE